MTAKYYAILTNQGAARLANATALGTKLNLTQMAVGDANGKLPTPDPAQTALINQQRIAPLNMLTVDPANASQIIAEQIIPENEGGFWIREIGLYDDDGVLIAVANCPETYKPKLAEGSGRTQTIRMILIVSSTTAITLKIDPSVVLATRQYVDDALEEHARSRNHPDGTTKAKGFVQLSSATDSNSEALAATPKAVKAVMDVASAAIKSVDNLKPDKNGNVDTGQGDSAQPVINIPPLGNGNGSYLKIATIKDCGSSSGYFQISVFGSGNYGRPGQSIETITVSCRGIANMKSTNADYYINHNAINNGSDSPLRIAAAPTANPGEFHVYLNASGGWWAGVKMRVDAIAGGGNYITGAVVDRYMGANAWATAKPANSFLATRSAFLNSGDIGTSGAKIPRLNTANTWAGNQTFSSDISVGTAEGTSVINLGESSQIIRDNSKKGLIITSNTGTLTDAGSGIYLRPLGSTDGNMEMHGNSSGWNTGKMTVGTLTLSDALAITNGGTGAKNAKDACINLGLGEGSALPIGVPVPWSTATAPDGWLKCNGAPFDKAKYPGLAVAYPSGKLPDLRGEFIRGWDDGRGVDSGRGVLASQDPLVAGHTHKLDRMWSSSDETGNAAKHLGVSKSIHNTTKDNMGNGIIEDVDSALGIVIGYGQGGNFTSTTAIKSNTTSTDNRPRNVAFNYIVRAA
ncbi:phage tail-collar fiber domain-containing protein [Klebsiella pneumoniae]|uniref:phage tail-collar fiber domain-containing protein n=1 Tax=Klebsiella pneumoniae TaxID=573 RepID=UPI0010EF9CBD|nr:phage tail protein [Klebsiella pneumoniae]VGD33856.1 Tail fiber protein [Klebsiella pneumoniae]